MSKRAQIVELENCSTLRGDHLTINCRKLINDGSRCNQLKNIEIILWSETKSYIIGAENWENTIIVVAKVMAFG